MKSNRTAVSLFCSGGVADLALRAAGYEILVANELIQERAEIFRANFPDCKTIVGDIREFRPVIVKEIAEALGGRELDLLFATPPCQGMSKNGRGKLLTAIRSGEAPKFDPRNQLIIDTVEVAKAVRPVTILLENVPEMRGTSIVDRNGSPIQILDFLRNELSPDYWGTSRVIEFADYGVPQRRQRLITIYTRDADLQRILKSDERAFPHPTHSRQPTLLQKPWITVAEVIAHLPALDAASPATASSGIPFHRVPLLDRDKYFWVSNTPPGRGAFDNQCVNSECMSVSNIRHGSSHDKAGINRAHKNTPLYCGECGHLLPRPWVRQGDEYRLMSGYTSAYKRMRDDLPASALTRNLSYACSDQKLHPRQNRVLSLKEAFLLHTIEDFHWTWSRAGGRNTSDKLIREIIGESVPPRGLLPFFQHIARLTSHEDEFAYRATG